MATREINHLLGHLRAAALQDERARLNDGQLLRRFRDHQDQAAFEMLVRRHGPMVLAVCRRVLRHAQDAEDAFQAAFLVLVRKSATLAGREVVGDWLHGVAYRTALKARSAAAARRAKERTMPRRQPRDDSPSELNTVLDRELNGLPAKYRVPIVLCDLEGKTRREAARQLGWPEGTVSGRLSRGRALLARRLTRCGFAISAGMVVQEAAPACVPVSLVQRTVVTATALVTGSAVSVASTPVTALMEGVLKTMLITKLKLLAAIVMTALVGIVAGAGGWTTWAAEPYRAPDDHSTTPPDQPIAEPLAGATLAARALYDRLPDGAMPWPCVAALESDGTLTIRRKYPASVTHRAPFHPSTVEGYNADGKLLEHKLLNQKLQLPTIAMLLPHDQPVDPRVLALFKEGTLFLRLPVPAPKYQKVGIASDFAFPVAEDASSMPPRRGKPAPTLWFKTKNITIHYSTKVAGSSPAEGTSVELWHTQDDGRTWRKFPEKTDLTKPFVLQVSDEGRHGFLVIVRSGELTSRAPPQPGEQPEVWVHVDTTSPVVHLFAPELTPGDNGDRVRIRWNAEDTNLGSHPVSLYYTHAAVHRGAWLPIASAVENSGHYDWDLPLGVSESLRISIQVTDRAGNTTVVEQPVRRRPESPSRPEGKIFRIEPSTSTRDGRTDRP
jgi:RNA polymerase sigma factor (sigma-70 family)